jgi:hypothetical protein
MKRIANPVSPQMQSEPDLLNEEPNIAFYARTPRNNVPVTKSFEQVPIVHRVVQKKLKVPSATLKNILAESTQSVKSSKSKPISPRCVEPLTIERPKSPNEIK